MLLVLLSSLVFELKSEELPNSFFDLSLEQLGEIQITSAAKKPQNISLTAASVFILHPEQIKRSGVTTIPDALRLVPGMQVAKMDGNKWAISIRGFNDTYCSSLLVLLDGRSLYSNFFGGVDWDSVDTVLEDLDRIEVVRGPGGTLWGSNAVNGVINIITKNAKDSRGLFVSGLAGNEETGTLAIRYGGEINPETNYRIYAKGFEKDEAKNGADDWRMGRAGFRIDSEPDDTNKLTLQSDVYTGEAGVRAVNRTTPTFYFNPKAPFATKTNVFGANVLFRWQHNLGEDSDFSVQAYYNHTDREHFYISNKHDTADVEFQHRFQTLFQQEIIWGLGARYSRDRNHSPLDFVTLSRSTRHTHNLSGFIQDEISLIDEQLILTLGTKLEHNSYTGLEYQPSARLLWKFYDQHSLWGSISRAIRTPAQIEQDGEVQNILPSNPFVEIQYQGNPNLEAEELIAYELGYRILNKQYSFDLSLFYNNYHNIMSIEGGNLIPGTTTPFIAPLSLANDLQGEIYGLDIAATWRMNDDWRLHGGYSFTQVQLHNPAGSTLSLMEDRYEAQTPHHQFTVQSFWQVSENWQWDTTLRYVDMIKTSTLNVDTVGSYITMDMRVAWQTHDDTIELAVIGQNLWGSHREFRSSTVDLQATDVEPSVFFKADFHF